MVNGNNTVTLYPPEATRPSATYTQGLSMPAYCTIGPDGSFWVSNAGNSTVVQYPAGAQTPMRTLTIGNTPSGIAITKDGALLVVEQDNTLHRVAPNGGKDTSTGIGIAYPAQFAIGPAGTYAFANQYVAGTFMRQPPNVGHFDVNLPTSSPSAFALEASGTHFFAADGPGMRVIDLTYPGNNFAQIVQLSGAMPVAIAVTPPYLP